MTLEDLATKGPKPVWIRYMLLIGVFTLTTRIILDSNFRHSAMLYILVPYLVAIAIYVFIPQPKSLSKLARFFKHMLAVVIVMLGTSAFLFEGFLCVLMFLPIYTLVAAITFALMKPREIGRATIADTFKVSILPLVILIMSAEGTTPSLSFDRAETITHTKIVTGDITTLKANMAMPIHLQEGRSPFLSLFPLPDSIDAGSLNAGDIHKATFVYKRWGITNIHRGETWIIIADVSDRHVRTEIVKDTSYFSKYLTVIGTEVHFKPLTNNTTEVTLSVTYTRLLDPAWYFGPMQRAAIGESAEYLIDQVIARPRNGAQ